MRVSARDGETRRAVYLSLLFSRVAETMRSIVECPPVDMRIPYLPALLHSPAVITLPPTPAASLCLPSSPPSLSSLPSPIRFSFLPSCIRVVRSCEKRSYLEYAIRRGEGGVGKGGNFHGDTSTKSTRRKEKRVYRMRSDRNNRRIFFARGSFAYLHKTRFPRYRSLHHSSLLTTYFNIFSI